MWNGRLAWIAEAFAGTLLFLLPLKFGALVGPPAITMIYWRDFLPLIISQWPFPVLPVLAAVFLATVLILTPGKPAPGRAELFAWLWILLAVAVLPGWITPVPDAGIYFIDHVFAAGAFVMGFALVLDRNPRLAGVFHGVFAAAFLVSLAAGLEQYFSGFENTLEQMEKSGIGTSELQENIVKRLLEQRVTGGFSACNAYAGYLILGLPVALAWLWKAGGRVTPPLASRILFTLPVAACGLFLLVKTGSRGGILSLCAAVFLTFLVLRTNRRIKIVLWSLLPAGIAGFVLMVTFWRGAKSLLFRLDYLQGAFRMMLESPLRGWGWGSFQRMFMKMKWIYDAEAPASPHNFPLSAGAQAGVAAFLAVCAILIFALWLPGKRIARLSPGEAVRDGAISSAGIFCGLIAWTVHSMQEILFETPAALLCFGAAACLLLAGENSGGGEGKVFSPAVRKIPLWIFAAVALGIGWKVLNFDSALAALNDMSDVRMMSREEFEKTDPAKLGEAFQRCVDLRKTSPYPYMTLSNYTAARGDAEAALALTRKALELDPDSSSLHMRLYRILRHAPGGAEEAREHLNRARELFPKNPKYAVENPE